MPLISNMLGYQRWSVLPLMALSVHYTDVNHRPYMLVCGEGCSNGAVAVLVCDMVLLKRIVCIAAAQFAGGVALFDRAINSCQQGSD